MIDRSLALETDLILSSLAVLLGASGTYLLLPHKHGRIQPWRVHIAGGVLSAIAALLFALVWFPPSELFSKLFFYVFGISALVTAVATVTARNPIHSALWFAAVVLATCGLFLLEGAQFLAAGTIIVYAGAIIVTFLFVIMLAQMEGRAAYDRASRSPFRATWTCFILFFGLVWSLFHIERPQAAVFDRTDIEARFPRTGELTKIARAHRSTQVGAVLQKAERPTMRLTDEAGRLKPHVAGLGETLYTDHLVVVELAGALLFAGLIGAIAIASPKPPVRPGDRTTATISV